MKRKLPNRAIKDSIIANACEYFHMQEEGLLRYSSPFVQHIVLFAIYTEANYTHHDNCAVFNRKGAHLSWCAMQTIVNAIRHRSKGANLILDFYKRYGYCKHLWEGRNAA